MKIDTPVTDICVDFKDGKMRLCEEKMDALQKQIDAAINEAYERGKQDAFDSAGVLTGEAAERFTEYMSQPATPEDIALSKEADEIYARHSPDSIRNKIRALWPEMNEDDIVLLALLDSKAIDAKSAITMPDSKALRDLVEAEHIVNIDGKYHLSKDAQMIAKSVACVYPEEIKYRQQTIEMLMGIKAEMSHKAMYFPLAEIPSIVTNIIDERIKKVRGK